MTKIKFFFVLYNYIEKLLVYGLWTRPENPQTRNYFIKSAVPHSVVILLIIAFSKNGREVRFLINFIKVKFCSI